MAFSVDNHRAEIEILSEVQWPLPYHRNTVLSRIKYGNRGLFYCMAFSVRFLYFGHLSAT